MKNTKYIEIFKHVSYCLVFILLYVIQNIPGLFVIGGVRPALVLPAAIALAMHEGEFYGGIYGAVAGLFCDMDGFLAFGFNGFITCVYCIAVGLTIIYLLRCNLFSCVLFVFIFSLIQGSLEFLFLYGMWGYADVWKIYANHTLPTVLYTTAVSPLLFYPMRRLFAFFEKLLENRPF